jgi:hypothetical protein
MYSTALMLKDSILLQVVGLDYFFVQRSSMPTGAKYANQ